MKTAHRKSKSLPKHITSIPSKLVFLFNTKLWTCWISRWKFHFRWNFTRDFLLPIGIRCTACEKRIIAESGSVVSQSWDSEIGTCSVARDLHERMIPQINSTKYGIVQIFRLTTEREFYNRDSPVFLLWTAEVLASLKSIDRSNFLKPP